MHTPQENETQAPMAELRAEMLALGQRVAQLERQLAALAATPAAAAAATTATAAAAATPATPSLPKSEITEDEMLSIAAAVAAYLGVRARIRQVRLVQSTAWAQVGRATIHASHRVH